MVAAALGEGRVRLISTPEDLAAQAGAAPERAASVSTPRAARGRWAKAMLVARESTPGTEAVAVGAGPERWVVQATAIRVERGATAAFSASREVRSPLRGAGVVRQIGQRNQSPTKAVAAKVVVVGLVIQARRERPTPVVEVVVDPGMVLPLALLMVGTAAAALLSFVTPSPGTSSGSNRTLGRARPRC